MEVSVGAFKSQVQQVWKQQSDPFSDIQSGHVMAV
jgi:hypothetical protein